MKLGVKSPTQGAQGFIPKPMIELMNSIKAEQNGTEVTVTGSMTAKTEDLIGGMLFPFMMMSGGGVGPGAAAP